MKTWTASIGYNFNDNLTNELFTEETIFFDIETTGFSPAYTTVYLIGFLYRKGENLILTQYFSETKEEEKDVLDAFFHALTPFDTVITFNGLGFDIPYLKAKCKTYELAHPFDEKQYIDIFKEASSLKKLLNLPNYKQKTIESFLGISRNDKYNGGELIDVYKEYLRNPKETSAFLLKQHNYEDVLGMPALLSVLSYKKLLNGAFSAQSVESNMYKDINGIYQKEIIILLKSEFYLPKRTSFKENEFYFTCDGYEAKLRVLLYEGTLKFFFDHPEDYYYLPEEDTAIHKSVASGVAKEFRKKATASNCYKKKDAIFVPQYETIITPFFKEKHKDKRTYFELTENFLDSPSLLYQYVLHVFRYCFTLLL